MLKKYRKKPVIIEAIQYTKDNKDEILRILYENSKLGYIKNNKIIIKTLEGKMELTEGNYLIKGIKGEFYPCRKDIFLATYEKID